MSPATIAAADRADELQLLEQLLAERHRPVPPPPPAPRHDKWLMAQAMRLIAQAMREAA